MTARSGLRSIATAIALLTASAFAAGFLGVRVNTSSSLPLGLYIRTDRSSAQLIEFCPSEPYGSLSRDRGYRVRGFTCPDRAVPLLKPVVARVGDVVRVSPAGIAVNGRLLPNTAALTRDAANRRLEAWPSGIYRVRPGPVWVASTYSRGSYDSRYIGPVEEKSIRGRLRPLWLLHS
jgi:conjugative transfer signal peptidase TraF